MPPEKKFANWLRTNTPWFTQRIETTTGSGIPDLWVSHAGAYAWIELKAAPAYNVQIRISQYAWIMKAAYHNVEVWIMNKCPKDDKVSVWTEPFEVSAGKAGYLRLVSCPDYHSNGPQVIAQLTKRLENANGNT